MRPAALPLAVVLCLGVLSAVSLAGASSPPDAGPPEGAEWPAGSGATVPDGAYSEDRTPSPTPVPVTTFDQYLVAFLSAYEMGLTESDALAAATTAVTHAETWWVPRLSFTERLETSGQRVDLDLSLDLRSSLYDSTAAPSAELAKAELTFRQTVAAESRVLAAAAFLQDVAAYAVTAAASDVARSALPGSRGTSMQPPGVLGLRPEQRARYEASLSSLQGASYLEATAAEVRERLAFRLRVTAHDLRPPGFSETTAYLASVSKLLTGPDAVVRCLAKSPAVRVAEARDVVRQRSLAVEAAHDLSVTLMAGIDYGHTLAGAPGTTGANHGTAMVEVSARYVLPSDWPFAGSAAASAGSDGFSQELSVSWPPEARRTPASDNTRSELEAELAAIEWDARALLRSVEQARAEKARRERALAWALLDASPGISKSEAATLAADALGSAWGGLALGAEPAIVQLRIEAAIGLLGETSAAIELAAHCGSLLPPGA